MVQSCISCWAATELLNWTAKHITAINVSVWISDRHRNNISIYIRWLVHLVALFFYCRLTSHSNISEAVTTDLVEYIDFLSILFVVSFPTLLRCFVYVDCDAASYVHRLNVVVVFVFPVTPLNAPWICSLRTSALNQNCTSPASRTLKICARMWPLATHRWATTHTDTPLVYFTQKQIHF